MLHLWINQVMFEKHLWKSDILSKDQVMYVNVRHWKSLANFLIFVFFVIY